jgi:beta-lactam-binding protein with PASTA domain
VVPSARRAGEQFLRENRAMAGEPRKMPRIHHLTLEQAQHTLQAEGLTFKLRLMQSKAVPEGELIAVSPRPGTIVEDESEVVLMVSSGPPIARP